MSDTNTRGLLAKHAMKSLPLYGNILGMLFSRGYKLINSDTTDEIGTFTLEGDDIRVVLERTMHDGKPIFEVVEFTELD